MSVGRVVYGTSSTDVQETKSVAFRGSERPILPILDGNGKIHVSISSFRDGKRCAQTLIDLFATAKDPDNIVVGLVEQNYEDDPFCLELFCQQASEDGKLEIYSRQKIRLDTIKIIAKQPDRSKCPRIDQIRKLAVHNVAAKGPTYARSLGRKVLGNEEFCLQIDAHMKFIQDWDVTLKEEWKATENEFAILSHPPAATTDYDKSGGGPVPRNCGVTFLDVKVPHYDLRGDGTAENLRKPLLSHAWTPGFSFAKCHLEESAPYDGFTPYVAGTEAFARYARFWTRGYDVFTPTKNIVYHNYNPSEHGMTEWMKPRKQRIKNKSLNRIRSYLEIPSVDEPELKLDNLGLYGLGRRRSLKQLNEFVGIDLAKQQARAETKPCANFQWVPYDTSISPVHNLYNDPDDLDPQPEYPLRTDMIFLEQVEIAPPDLEVLEGDLHPMVTTDGIGKGASAGNPPFTVADTFPSFTLIFLFWIVGLVLWVYYAFAETKESAGGTKKTKMKKDLGSFKEK